MKPVSWSANWEISPRAYENDIYRLLKYLLNINLLIESRHIKEAMDEVNRGIDLVQRKGWDLSTIEYAFPKGFRASVDGGDGGGREVVGSGKPDPI